MGGTPRWKFSDGVAATVRWYKENAAWVDETRSGAYRDYFDISIIGDAAARNPYNGPFSNWQLFSFTTTNLSIPFTVSIHDTYADSGWLGIDSIDVKLQVASAVSEPSSLVLLASSMVAALGCVGICSVSKTKIQWRQVTGSKPSIYLRYFQPLGLSHAPRMNV